MYVKAAMFVFIGLLSAAGILVAVPRWDVAVLMALCVWGFARAYYFAFYVIQHYVDPGYRFAGLMDFGRYLLSRRRADGGEATERWRAR